MRLKKIFFYNIAIFISFFLILDVLVSIFFLDIKTLTCFNIQRDYYDLKKNCSGIEAWKSSFPSVKIDTNNLGLRYSGKAQKNNSKEKIFFLGDSLTYGVGIEFNKTFFGILENRHPEYKFYNFAVPSYSTTLHLYLLKKEIEKENIPSKIILMLDPTDIWDEGSRWKDNGDERPTIISKKYEEKHSERKEVNKTFSQKYFQISKMFISNLNYRTRNFRHRLKKKYLKDYDYVKTSFQANFTYTKVENLNKKYWEPNVFEKGISEIRNDIELISNISRNNNIEFFLAVYPFAETLVNGQKEFNWEKFGESLCASNQCKFINVFTEFKRRMVTNKYWLSDNFFVHDEHYNNGGHEVMANVIDSKMF